MENKDNVIPFTQAAEEKKIPHILESPYRAHRKSDGATCLCVLRAKNAETDQMIIAFGVLDDEEATHISYLEESRFYELYTVTGPTEYQFAIDADAVGETSSTAGGASLVKEKAPCQCGKGKGEEVGCGCPN